MATNADSAKQHLGEPNCIEQMSLSERGNSVQVTIPDVAVKFLGYDASESRAVEVYPDGVFIPAEAVDE